MELLLGIVSLLVTVVGIPLAYFFGRRNRQRPDLRASTDFDQVMAPLSFAGGLSLTWRGRSLTQVSRTNIAFWNHRGDMVRGVDIVASDRLRVEVADDDEILQVRIGSFSREQIGLTLDGGDVKFDFLDAGDGGVLEVLHIGDEPARIAGTVRGAKVRTAVASDLSPRGRSARVLPARMRLFSGPGRGQRIFWTGNLILALVGIGLAVSFMFTRLNRTPMLVERSGYDLGSIEGQAEFAQRVASQGEAASDPTFIVLFIVMSLFYVALLIIASLRLLKSLRAAEPASIFAFDEDGAGGASITEQEAKTTQGRGEVVNVSGGTVLRNEGGRWVIQRRSDSSGRSKEI
ncbi:hypothetical protein FGL91_10710 [Microbacterium sp. CBA3102]|uniref:hypothetical protein n=1 Tax=Microbacterium sp. CBA3102 TaxID=2603598 RepID=UPI0011BB9CAD|nr:hypothetical protein [Microbacterium sp. CBA3102]QEA28987.1 hypothetical protein FGL91_10710 [Microbacterium sp. CBA3102]